MAAVGGPSSLSSSTSFGVGGAAPTAALNDQQQPLPQPRLLCTNCVEVLTSLYIECVECAKQQKPQVTLCAECFSMGAECGDHKRTHLYRVVRPGGVAIFGASAAGVTTTGGVTMCSSANSAAMAASSSSSSSTVWSSAEEVALVEAAERYNLGNWDDVVLCVNPSRSVAEVKEHYDRFYLRGRIGQIANKSFVRPTATDHTETVKQRAMCLTAGLTSPPIRSAVQKISYDDLRLLAYMPHRDDFEKEWNNEAEELVSKLLPAPDDDDLDKAVKLAHVDMYVRVVAERRKRKAMARDYDLVPAFFKQEKPGYSTKAWKYTPQTYQKMKRENELREQLKKISQVLPAAEFNELVHGLAKQDLLKERIEELQKLRKSGVSTLEGDEKTKFSERLQLICAQSTDEIHDSAVANSSSTRQCTEKSAEPNAVSASTTKTENSTIVGIESDAGRRSLPNLLNQMDDDGTDEDRQPTAIISNHELSYCMSNCLDVDTYLLLKMCLLKEQQLKAQGIPVKANIRQDFQEAKQALKQCMKQAGWLPVLSQ